jgi:hypothetical protein
MKESEFNEYLLKELKPILPEKYTIESNANLYYKLTLNNELELEQNDLKNPRRGSSAFQTDILISESRNNLKIPKVVIELKFGRLTTHDVITYSSKASRHKKIYPYLRYGMTVYGIAFIPQRFFTHNEFIDFMITFDDNNKLNLIYEEIKRQIGFSDELENNIFRKKKSSYYSLEPRFSVI